MFLEAASYPTASALGTQITMSALAVAFVQWLKNSPLMPYMHAGSDVFNRIVSMVLAALSALGIHAIWSSGAAAGTYTLTFTGLTLGGVALTAWAMVKSFAFNELIYRSTVKSVVPPPPAGVQVVGGQAGAPVAQELKAEKV